MDFLACMHVALFLALSLSPGNSRVTSHTEGDGKFYVFAHVGRYIDRYIDMFVYNFLAPI